MFMHLQDPTKQKSRGGGVQKATGILGIILMYKTPFNRAYDMITLGARTPNYLFYSNYPI